MNTPPTHALAAVLERTVVVAAQDMLAALSPPSGLSNDRVVHGNWPVHLPIETQEQLHRSLAAELPLVSRQVPASHTLISSQKDYFIIDPLDGTSSYKRFFNQAGSQLGFGPLGGLVRDGRLEASVFVHLPRRLVFTAYRGGGTWVAPLKQYAAGTPQKTQLTVAAPLRLEDSALLFHPGSIEELRFVEYLRTHDLIQNAYRFGGFANDCSRLASGFEQCISQFSIRAWDFPAALLASEAGILVIADPLGTPTNEANWRIAEHNPLLLAPPALMPQLLQHLRKSVST